MSMLIVMVLCVSKEFNLLFPDHGHESSHDGVDDGVGPKLEWIGGGPQFTQVWMQPSPWHSTLGDREEHKVRIVNFGGGRGRDLEGNVASTITTFSLLFSELKKSPEK